MLIDLVLFGTLAIGLLPDSVFSQEQVAANATELPPAKTAKVLLHVKSDRDLPEAMEFIDSIDVLANETDKEIIQMRIQRQGGCPLASELPIMDHEDNVFYGARVWTHRGGRIASLACNPKELVVYKAGEKHSVDQGSFDRFGGFNFGTLYVHKGCTVYIFQKSDYQGKMKKFSEGYYYNGPSLYEFNYIKFRWWVQPMDYISPCKDIFNVPCAPSFSVQCDMTVPKCAPFDKWVTLTHQANQGSTPMEVTYTKTIGTSWSKEYTKEFHHSYSITAAVKATLYGLFESELSATSTTGYNWKAVTSEAKSETTSLKISVTIPVGTVTTILQATGYCGNTAVKTEMFRHINKPINLPVQCNSKNYRTLNEHSRSSSYTENNVRLFKGDVITWLFDTSPSWEGPGWYRFVYPAGKVMATWPPPKKRCSSASRGWMVDSHPTEAGQTKVVKFCFTNYSGSISCYKEYNGKVTNCGAGEFVYKLPEPCKGCKARYCGATTTAG